MISNHLGTRFALDTCFSRQSAFRRHTSGPVCFEDLVVTFRIEDTRPVSTTSLGPRR